MKNRAVIFITLALFIFSLVVYAISNFGRDTPYNYFTLLADAFLHGRLYLTDNPAWLNELVKFNGHYYVVYPPMPAILLAPLVFLFGVNFQQTWLSIFLASLNVSLCFLVILLIFKNKRIAFWNAILYGFGTIVWFHATVGSAWYIAHIAAMTFLWFLIIECLTKKRLLLIGFFVGLSYLSRLPTVLAIAFPLVLLYDKFFIIENKKLKDISLKNFLLLGLGLGPFVLLNFLYNYLRYGTINDIGYQLLPIFSEPWYQYGLFNIRYIPTHLKEAFTALPKFTSQMPYITPSLNVLAIWFTTPAFVLSLLAEYKKRVMIASVVAIGFILIPVLTHGNNGFSQFGYRYFMDFYPFLMILTASGMRNKVSWWKILIIMLSILINLWSVVMISFLNIWTF